MENNLVIRKFNKKREIKQNPYTGFMSFQHFRGEKMYSDIVVLPENNYTETERVECYPPSPDAEERGREEGYYPDTSVVYIRILWKEFEPRRGEYNYAFIDEIIRQAREHEQSLIFRLMAHSTRKEDDVPEWLKSLMPCPERPDGERVKDSPTDPLFLDLFLLAIEKIADRYDADPTFYAIDISLPGAWGEGHNLHLYPDNTLERIVDLYTEKFKNTQLFGQVSKPELIERAGRVTNIGWRGDGFGHPMHMEEIYPSHVERLSEVWKTAPISFESYWWLGEWYRKGWDIDKIIKKSLEWHISSFNPKSMPAPYEWRDKIDAWIDRMGYHYVIEESRIPKTARIGESVAIVVTVNNVGVAPIYQPIPLKIKLSGKQEELFETDIDVREIMPGVSKLELCLMLPNDIEAGEYRVNVGILGEGYPTVYFATDAPYCDGYYEIGNILIV